MSSLVDSTSAQHSSSAPAATSSATAAPQASLPTSLTARDNLVTDMNAAIAADPDGLTASASLTDLTTNQTYNAGGVSTLYKAASTAKVLAAVDYLHQVELGQATLTENIDGTPASQLLQQMIEVSDDQAWADINDFLGDQQQTYATDTVGLSSFTGGEYNTMTAADMAKLLTELDQDKLINTTDRNLLYGYMEHTTSTNLIQAALPAGATVYHKYGQLWGYLNDAAIVNYQGHDFVLVIYTNNTDGTTDEYTDQVALIHAITAAAFKDIVAS